MTSGLPPDVNESGKTSHLAPIFASMGAVRNVGAHVVAGMVKAREEQGAFTTFQDFFKKVPQEVCNKRTIESIIKAGGFDSLGYTRRSLLAVHEEAVDASMVQKRQEANNQFDFFSLLEDSDDVGMDTGFGITVPDLPEWDKKTKLSFDVKCRAVCI